MGSFRGFPPIKSNFTAIPNVFFDELLSEIKSVAELKVLLYIFRHTYGWQKRFDCISLNQFVNGVITKEGVKVDNGIGIDKKSVLRGIESCLERGTILKWSDGLRGREQIWYFINTEENRRYLLQLETGATTIEEIVYRNKNQYTETNEISDSSFASLNNKEGKIGSVKVPLGGGELPLGSGEIPPVEGSGKTPPGGGKMPPGSGEIPPVEGSSKMPPGGGKMPPGGWQNATGGSGKMPPGGWQNATGGSGKMPPTKESTKENSTKENLKKTSSSKKDDDVRVRLKGYGFKDDLIEELVERYGPEYIEAEISKLEGRDDIKNKGGYLNDALRNGYRSAAGDDCKYAIYQGRKYKVLHTFTHRLMLWDEERKVHIPVDREDVELE